MDRCIQVLTSGMHATQRPSVRPRSKHKSSKCSWCKALQTISSLRSCRKLRKVSQSGVSWIALIAFYFSSKGSQSFVFASSLADGSVQLASVSEIKL